MWTKPYSYREGTAIAVGLMLVGLMLQLSVGPIDWDIFMWPANIVALLLLVAIVVAIEMLRGKVYFLRFITTGAAAVPAIATAVVLTIIMGITPQVSAATAPKDPLGLTRMLGFWPFVLVYFWMTLIVGAKAADQLRHLRHSQKASMLSHIGLFTVLACGTLGSADMQRLRMFCEQGKPEWRGLDAWNNVVQLPFAIELDRFTIDQYPPKLMVIDAQGRPLPLDKPDFLSVDSGFTASELQGWQVSVVRCIDSAMPSALAQMVHTVGNNMSQYIRLDSLGQTRIHPDYVASDEPGSECAMLVKATKGNTTCQGWISCGSYRFPYQGLQLDSIHTLVMGSREPRRFASTVDVYTIDGKSLRAEITVNHPLTVKGWKVYQYSYNEQMGRWSTLSVFELVSDPWLPVVYFGILLLAVGAVLMFVPKRKEARR